MTVRNETYDELAGIVDLFGALTRTELRRALDELAYRQGTDAGETALSGTVEDAVSAYYLVEYTADGADGGDTSRTDDAGRTAGDANAEGDGETLLTVGPVAFPRLPPNAEDLPHILDVEHRRVDRESLGEQVRERLEADAVRALDEGDRDRIERLVDVSYDVEAWAPIDVTGTRAELAESLQDKSNERQ